MKVICVVDSITDINNKINILKTNFSSDVLFVVKASIQTLFETYGHKANAVYDKNLTKIIHVLLSKNDSTDIVIYYTSLKIDNKLITEFIKKIGNKSKIVNLVPNYNIFEQIVLGAYNIYVKSLFKTKDSLASPKLQFLPQDYVTYLLTSHIGNKLFEMPYEVVSEFHTEDKEINKTSKIKTKFGKSEIIALLVLMCLMLCTIFVYAFTSPHFLVSLIIVMLYLLDIVFYLLLKFKAYFDARFLK